MRFYKLLFILILFSLYSCEQILNSVAKEAGHEIRKKDSIEFAYNEKPIAVDTFNIIKRKKIGTDSFFLIRSYYLTGSTYYESWQRNNVTHGLTTFFFPSGNTQYTIEYKEGRAYSLINSYDKNGVENDGGSLKNGTGNLKIYHPITGNLIYSTEYTHGLRNGKYLSFYSDGKQHENMVLKNDTVVGTFITYYHSGNILEKGNLNMTTLTSVVENYYETGKLQTYDEWKNGKQITYKEFDENGFLISEKATVDGKLIGTKSYYNAEGILLSRGQMYNDKKHGNYDYFYANGNKKSLEVYRNDTILSETVWYENGKLNAQSNYKDGLKTGIYKEYYSTGNIKLEQTYVKGLREGKYKSYFNNGTIYNDGTFKHDSLSGDLKFYSENGTLKGVKKYN